MGNLTFLCLHSHQNEQLVSVRNAAAKESFRLSRSLLLFSLPYELKEVILASILQSWAKGKDLPMLIGILLKRETLGKVPPLDNKPFSAVDLIKRCFVLS